MTSLPLLILLALGCGSPPAGPPITRGGDITAARRAPAGQRARGKQLTPKDLAERIEMKGTFPTQRKLRAIADLEEGEPALVAMVILDTLRADHTAFCGYDKPNTPVMGTLRELGGVWSCDAYSPATWTLPAHASYFTGAPTAEHGVHTLGTPLSEDYVTLAEEYAERGYQTLFVSANPVFAQEASGFWQGFDRVAIAKGLVGPMRGDGFATIFASEIAKLSTQHPVFMVVNIFDAHDPYPAVPPGVPWARQQRRLNLQPHTPDPKNPYFAYVTGEMPEADKPGYLAAIRNAYDHAISMADRNLGAMVQVLRRKGWAKQPSRLVITSDHGEHLGEHGLLRHGSATWQTVTRVPFLYIDTTGAEPVELPSPLNATIAHELLLNGRLPEPALLVESASGHNSEDFKPSWNTVSLWADTTDKLQFFDGELRRFDLSSDPMEDAALPLGEDHPLSTQLADRVAAHEASIAAALERGQDPAVMEALKSVGYIQDDLEEAGEEE